MSTYRRGGRCPESSYVPPQQYFAAIGVPVAQELRGLQRLATMEFLRLMHEGDHHEAAEHLHDTFRATRLVGRRGCIIERLIGVACHANLVQGWHEWSRHPDVTADEIETALNRLREDWKLTPPLSDHLKAEYLLIANEAKPPMPLVKDAFETSWNRLMRKRLKVSAEPLFAQMNARAPGWQTPLLWVWGEPELLMRGAKLYFTQELHYCDLPFTKQPTRFAAGTRLHDSADLTAGLTSAELNQRLDITIMHAFNIPFLVEKAVRGEAGRQMLLESEMLLQIHFRRAGVSSRSDTETLIADFPWPVDPCSAEGKPIQCRALEEGLLIWSLGHDGLDQGGKFIQNSGDSDIVVTIPWPSEQP